MPSRQSHSRRLIFCFLAALLGVVGAAVAKLLLVSINVCTNLFYFHRISTVAVSPAENHLGWLAAIVPALGGLVVGMLARLGSPAIRGHGIPEAMEQILTNESRIPKRIAWLKPLSAAIAIGSGGPFGAEGPIIATGSALGSMLGQSIAMSPAERKTLLACGAAAGMTAIFGTPLAAVLLAIELLLFEFRPLTFIPVTISAVVAATLHFLLFDKGAFFVMPLLATPAPTDLCVYLLAGVFFGLLAVIATKTVYFVEDLFDELPIHWMWWPAMGGVAVGLIGLLSPLSLGVGYGNIDGALAATFTLGGALALLGWKFLSWVIALSSGTSGGTLAPLLTIGSLSGMILGTLLNKFFPGLGVDIHALALVGMAAVFAGSSRSLLASVVFALEATRQPLGMVPLLGACSIAYLFSHRLMKNSIMTEKIARRGISVPHEYFPAGEDGL